MWTLIAVLVLIGIWFYRRSNQMSILSRNGIPGPKPNFIFGNLFIMRPLTLIQKQKALIEKYGKVVGCYLGANPVVLVADPELAKNILIKDFNYFTDRPHIGFRLLYPSVRNNGSLLKSCGKRWKQLRSILTPAFSAAKLNIMTPIIDDSINSFLEIIDKNSKIGEEFDIYLLYKRLTTDVILRTAFGTRSDVQNETNNKFLKSIQLLVEAKLNKLVYVFASCFPELYYLIRSLIRFDDDIRYKLGLTPMRDLMDMSSNIIKMRKENPKLWRKDLLQVMLDLKISSEEISEMSNENLTADYDESNNKINNSNNGRNGENLSKDSKNNIRLTEDEIKINCVMFYTAGFETTSTTLAFVAHILVNYPEVQEKVRQEVKQLYETEGKLDFKALNKLEYMEYVINETLRIYPPVTKFVARECLKDYKYNDITIPKGTSVVMATHYLHHDSDYWPEPEKFDPMRFSPERKHEIHPSSWQPFGGGPRNCIGMRFAFFEIKLSLAKLLLNYRLEKGPKTEIGHPTTICKVITFSPKNGIFVKAIKL